MAAVPYQLIKSQSGIFSQGAQSAKLKRGIISLLKFVHPCSCFLNWQLGNL